MTRASIAELVETWRPRYLRASRKEKTRILNEFVAITGYHRKAAIRLLRNGRKPKAMDRRGRPRMYTPDVKAILLHVWEAYGRICSKRLRDAPSFARRLFLAPFLPETTGALERAGELKILPDTKRLLVRMSAATMDRLLRTHRTKKQGRCTTKPGTLLKEKIPVHTFADWNNVRPEETDRPRRSVSLSGFLEMDLVAHCGQSTAGEYLHTLNAVDVATGWCEPLPLPNRSQEAVSMVIDKLRRCPPFPLLGIDSDNDSAFINGNLLRYCQKEKITFTRCRPNKKNDQAHVEQKNWTAVRKLIGYDRYESTEALALLEAIYADWRLYVNFFQPVRKLLVKERAGSKVHKRYDEAKTPYQRVLVFPDVGEEEKERLRELYRTLNPVALRHRRDQPPKEVGISLRIDENLKKLWRLHG